MVRKLQRVVLAALVCAAVDVGAQVRVTKGAGGKSAFDLSGLTSDSSSAAMTFRRTLEGDLARSGWFAIVGQGRGEFRLLGSVEGSGDVRAKCQVYGTVDQRSYLSKSYRASAAEARSLAHRAADDIILAITGQRGMNSARMVVVGNATGKKELYICDADGQNLRQLTNDKNISIAPQWSPKGDSIFYTSYLKRFPDIFMIELASGKRSRVSSFPGLNTGAAMSPNGRELALILSKDGNPELYVKNMGSDQLSRITNTKRAGEASPSWSPDGNYIAYVSDVSGRPQIYSVARSGGQPRRLTSRGSENVAPDWGPNGLIAFSSRLGSRYVVCIMDPNTLETRQVSMDDADYEDPSWAPDGRHIACGRSRQYKSSVYLLDRMGDPPIALLEKTGDWYSPSWSP